MIIKVGTVRAFVCRQTHAPVLMKYTGENDGSKNGHPGWLCLHNVEVADTTEGDLLLDKAEADAFNAGYGKTGS